MARAPSSHPAYRKRASGDGVIKHVYLSKQDPHDVRLLGEMSKALKDGGFPSVSQLLKDGMKQVISPDGRSRHAIDQAVASGDRTRIAEVCMRSIFEDDTDGRVPVRALVDAFGPAAGDLFGILPQRLSQARGHAADRMAHLAASPGDRARLKVVLDAVPALRPTYASLVATHADPTTHLILFAV